MVDYHICTKWETVVTRFFACTYIIEVTRNGKAKSGESHPCFKRNHLEHGGRKGGAPRRQADEAKRTVVVAVGG